MNWKKYPYWLKGGLIGVIFGVIFVITGVTGTIVCHWSPVGGDAVPEGICSNNFMVIVFYGPLFIAFFASIYLFGWTYNWINNFVEISEKSVTLGYVVGYFIASSITLIIISFILGALVGYTISNIIQKKDFKLLILIIALLAFIARLRWAWILVAGVIIWWVIEKIKSKK